MQNEYDLGVLRVVQLLFDDAVADSDVRGRVAQVALNEAFDDIEQNTGTGKR
jgi:hypothetical protein